MSEAEIVRNYDGLVEAFRARKEALGLSNKVCDELLNRPDGFTDHYLGRADRSISATTFIMFCELFALEFVPQINIAAAQRMANKWEGRDKRAVRTHAHPISMRQISRSKPYVLMHLGQQGGIKRNEMLSPKHKSDIARKGAKTRWKRFRQQKRDAKKAAQSQQIVSASRTDEKRANASSSKRTRREAPSPSIAQRECC